MRIPVGKYTVVVESGLPPWRESKVILGRCWRARKAGASRLSVFVLMVGYFLRRPGYLGGALQMMGETPFCDVCHERAMMERREADRVFLHRISQN